ncbi:Protein of unknown function [Bacillus toyonensis]|jgi:hypothetical protein
MKES